MWMQRLLEAIDRAYERRLRRASGLVVPAHAAMIPTPSAGADPDTDDTEIANVSLGTVIAPPGPVPAGQPAATALPDAPRLETAPGLAEQEDGAGTIAHIAPGSGADANADEATIANIRPGSSAEEDDGEGTIVNLPPGGRQG
jgi:hypothetical protein